MKKIIIIKICLFLLVCLPLNLFSQDSKYEVKDFIKIGGEAKWDYLTVDNTIQKLFVSNSSKVHVIDLNNNKIVAEISGLSGVHGVVMADEFGKAYISEGGSNSIAVIDTKTFKLINTLKIDGKKPDAIYYDGFSKKVYVCNGGSDNITVIDPKTDKTVATIKLDGAPESPIGDMKGKIFVNIEDKNEVQVIDTKSFKVLNTWSLSPCATPTGIAMDIKNNRLFVGCRSKHGVVLNAENGKILAQLPIGAGVDAGGFDPETKLIFFSCKEGVISVAKENSPNDFVFLYNIKTEPGAKNMVLDMITHKIYASASKEMNTESNSNAKPEKMFGVLVIDK